MQQIKVFIGIEGEQSVLEREVNTWIEQNKVKVVSIRGNIAPQTLARQEPPASSSGRTFRPSDLFILIVYEK